MKPLLDNILRDVDRIPSLPITVSKILDITKDPNVSPHELNKVISLDPVLTGRILKLVNSAYYSLTEKVTSIVKAIIYLGVNTIRNVTLASAVVPLVGTHANKSWMVLDVHGYWKHSLATGVVAKQTALLMGIDKKLIEEFFISGLIHDIGKVILDHNISESYLEVINQVKQGEKSLLEAEVDLLGTDHAHVGKLLAEKWELPKSIIEVIEFHHNPKNCQLENRQLVYSVSLANDFCNLNKIGLTLGMGDSAVDFDLINFLNLKKTDFDELKTVILEEIDKASVFLNLD